MPPSGDGETRAVYVVQRHFRRVRRGYDPDEVDRHLQVVSEWFRQSGAADQARELEKKLQARERAVGDREEQPNLLNERNRLEAEALLDGARLPVEAAREAAGRILEDAESAAEERRETAERVLAEARAGPNGCSRRQTRNVARSLAARGSRP